VDLFIILFVSAALSKDDKDRGLAAMGNLSPAAQVRKAFFTGRPATLLTIEQAVDMLWDKTTKLTALQINAGLKAVHVRGYLVWKATDSDGLNKSFFKRLERESDKATMLVRVNSFADAKILGLMFTQTDGEEINAQLMPMATSEEDRILLLKARKDFLSSLRVSLDN
jgi:hypothetical protein